jgi:hypothetical protein
MRARENDTPQTKSPAQRLAKNRNLCGREKCKGRGIGKIYKSNVNVAALNRGISCRSSRARF